MVVVMPKSLTMVIFVFVDVLLLSLASASASAAGTASSSRARKVSRRELDEIRQLLTDDLQQHQGFSLHFALFLFLLMVLLSHFYLCFFLGALFRSE
jgi:hypothetical protein